MRASLLPSRPANMRTGSITSSSVDILWDIPSGNQTTYFRTFQNRGSPITVQVGDPLRRTFSGLTADTFYPFEVEACNDWGCSTEASLSARTMTVVPLPPAPSNLRQCVANEPLRIYCLLQPTELRWNDNSSDEDRFELEYTMAQPNVVPFDMGSTITTVQILPNRTTYGAWLTSGNLCYFRIRAHNAGGYSPYSNVLTVSP